MILLDYRDRRPIYEQIVERFVELMVTGVMPQDSQMPSVRSMAMELSINPNTIQRAYAELERQGYIYSVKGKGSFVAENRHIMERRGEEMLQEFRALAEQARSLGLEKERLFAVISAVYEKITEEEPGTGGTQSQLLGQAQPKAEAAELQKQPKAEEAELQAQPKEEAAELQKQPKAKEAELPVRQQAERRQPAAEENDVTQSAGYGKALREEGETS